VAVLSPEEALMTALKPFADDAASLQLGGLSKLLAS
jgi:hypothetical protein